MRVILGGEWKKLEERERLRQKVEKVERENDKDGHLCRVYSSYDR